MVESAVLLAPSLLRFLLVENCGGCRVPEAVNSGDCSSGDKVTAAKRVKYALTVFRKYHKNGAYCTFNKATAKFDFTVVQFFQRFWLLQLGIWCPGEF